MCCVGLQPSQQEHKSLRTWPGSLYQSSSCSRSGWAFLRLISAMTSKTSESELLEQVLSSSDSHSDSLELSTEVRGEDAERLSSLQAGSTQRFCRETCILHEGLTWRFTSKWLKRKHVCLETLRTAVYLPANTPVPTPHYNSAKQPHKI